jgi:two-component system OmpR family response regulator
MRAWACPTSCTLPLTRVVPQQELVDHIYAQDFERDSNTVEVFVARLRCKLGASFIETVRGLGYRVGAPS